MNYVPENPLPQGDARLEEAVGIAPHLTKHSRKAVKLPDDYEKLGYRNGMSLERDKEVTERYAACRDAGHATGSYSTERGSHADWCCQCKYVYRTDSGD